MFSKACQILIVISYQPYGRLNLVNLYRRCSLLSKELLLYTGSVHTRKLVSTNSICIKQDPKGITYRDTENEFAHHIMENLLSYRETIVKRPFKSIAHSTEMTVSKIELTDYRDGTAVDTFLRVSKSIQSNELDLENELYRDLISAITREISSVSDETLINILMCLSLWPPTNSTETPNFKTLWNALDNECVNRIEKWPVNRQLLVADYWFHLRLSRISKYNITMINALVRKVNSLLPFQIVQLLFYINLQRHVKPRTMHYLEAKLNAVLPSCNVNEVGIVCLGFFKTKTKMLDSGILKNVINFTLKNISEVDYISLSAILKQLKNSSTKELTNDFSALLSKCAPFVKNWPPVTGIHLILLGSYIDLHHPIITDAVTENILPNIREIRLKDLEKLLFCTAKHRHAPQQGKKLFETVINELRSCHREDEVNCYPHCFLSSLLYLAYFGIYPEDLLSRALSPSFLQMIQEKSSLNYYQEIVTLHYSVEVELPHNKGQKLSAEELREILLDVHTSAELAPNSFQDRFQKSVVEELRKLKLGEKFFSVRRVLPYSSNSDIIMCKKKDGKFLPLSEKIKELPPEKIIKPGPGNYKWLCLTLMPKSSYSSSNQLLGLPAMKKRQLEKLGYHVVEEVMNMLR